MEQEVIIELNVTRFVKETQNLSMEEAGKLIMQLIEPYKTGLLKAPVKKVRKVSEPKGVLFKDDPLFTMTHFAEVFKEWPKKKMRYYYDAAVTWSGEDGGNKKVNWKRTIETWVNKDEAEGKLKFEEGSKPLTAADKEKAFKERGLA